MKQRKSKKNLKKKNPKKISLLKDLTAEKTNPFRRSNQVKRDQKSKDQETLDKWYGMAKKELTKDLENELTILKLKRYLHKTSFVKNPDTKELPKYFEVKKNIFFQKIFSNFLSIFKKFFLNFFPQVGYEVEDGLRRNRKKKKGTLFDQLQEIDEELGFSKRKFREIQVDKAKRFKNKRFRKLRRVLIKGQKKLKKKFYT